MALTRNMLKGLGITDEQISAIIEAHTESTDALKAQRDTYKADAEKLPEVQKELDALKEDGGSWKAKYDKEKADFEAYKSAQTAKEAKTAKETAYRQLLKDAGINEKRIDAIIKVTDLEAVEMADGKIKDAETLTEGIKTEWAEFIVSEQTSGAQTKTPPAITGKEPDMEALSKMSMAEYAKYRKGL